MKSPALEQRKKPRWLMLDSIVHSSSSRRRCEDATASALAHDCAGRPIRASLRIADPPAVSRLHLHLPCQPPIKHLPDPMAIAAHRNCILFRLTVPFTDDCRWNHTPSIPKDYFVYTCHSSSSPPSLTLLPPCFHGGITSSKYDWSFYQPHYSQQQRSMLEEEIGILCHGDNDHGEFTVAQLRFSGPDEFELCVLHHHPPLAPGTSMEWRVQKLMKPTNMMTSAYSWRTDVVGPIGRRCLCWVDNYLGMLLVDGLTDSKSNPDQQQWRLHYIPLPSKALKSQRPYKDGGVADPLRCVSVTDAGIIKLVCIIEKRSPSPYPFTIRTWTLDDVDEGKWTTDVDTTMGAEELFRLLGTDGHSCLPRVQPSFPLVSLVDPDVICFLLDDMDSGLFWTVEVNMRNKKLLSSAPYICPRRKWRWISGLQEQFLCSPVYPQHVLLILG